MASYAACIVRLLGAYALHMTYTSIFYHRGLAHGVVLLTLGMVRFVNATGMWICGVDAKAWAC
jgi:hypothetical protein